MSEPCRFCINWVNGSECEIGMPQQVCPSRTDLAKLLTEIQKKSLTIEELQRECTRWEQKYALLSAELQTQQEKSTQFRIKEDSK